MAVVTESDSKRSLLDGTEQDGLPVWFRYFSLMADECTDASNKEQLAICLRHVDQFCHIPNIFSDTLVSVIKDVLLRMNLSLFKCRGQRYDGAGTMVGCRNGVAAQLLADVPSAHLTHCYGHTMHLV